MKPKDFVKEFYKQKKFMTESYLEEGDLSWTGGLIQSLDLDEKGRERMRQIVDGILTDTFYTFLLAMDGAAPIGNTQQLYRLLDENGVEITGGEIEVAAWEYFHNHQFEAENGQADFIAELVYLSEGGRTTPVRSGYRPQIKFAFDEMQTSGQQQFINQELVFPGDRVNAEIKLLAVDHLAHKLKERMRFEFREGSRLIGHGKILRIVNEKLERQV